MREISRRLGILGMRDAEVFASLRMKPKFWDSVFPITACEGDWAAGAGEAFTRHTPCNRTNRSGAGMHEVWGFAGDAVIRTTELYYVRREVEAEQAVRRIQNRLL
jgi:hypothetical protein